MIITCPSCQKTHNTEMHKGAFEIECDCGYSILIPDEAALSAVSTPNESPGFQAPPIALDEEDEKLSIDLNDNTSINEVDAEQENPFAPFDGAVDMTPENELPTGMIYDPDEASALAESKEAWSESSSVAQFQDPFEAKEETKSDSTNSEPEATPAHSVAQSLVNMNQSASLGRLTGSLYDLSFESMSEDLCAKLSAKSEELLLTNPWIKQIVEDSGSLCAPKDFIVEKKVRKIPEVLALEIYLYCYEIGGQCKLLNTQSLETHSP